MNFEGPKGITWVYAAFCLGVLLIILVDIFKTQYAVEQNDHGILKTKKYNKFMVFLFFVPITVISSCRTYFIDTLDYIRMYEAVGTDFSNIDFDYFANVEHGFLYFNVLLNLITPNSQFLFIVTSIIIYYCFFKFIFENCEDVPFALMIFLCYTWTNTMNGLRQYLVAAILCVAWSIWAKSSRSLKNDFMLIIVVLLSMQFHKSAFICAIVFLVCRGKFLNMGTIFTIIGTIAIYLIPGLYKFIFDILLNSESYSQYKNVNSSMGIMRFIVCLVPMLLIWMYSSKNKSATSDETDITNWMINMCIFDFSCSVLALKMVFFARLGIYFGIFTTVMIPNLINRLIKGENKTIVKAIAFFLYVVYFLYQMKAYGGYMKDFELCF